jgi:hypothetical protein
MGGLQKTGNELLTLIICVDAPCRGFLGHLVANSHRILLRLS